MKAKILGLIAAGLLAGPAAHGGSIETTFAGGNTFAGNMFDVTTAANSLSVTAFDVHVGVDSPGAGAAVEALISVYRREGGYSGFETNAGAWTLMGQTSVTSQGGGNKTFVDISDFLLAANTTYGFYVSLTNYTSAGIAMIYTNGSNFFSNSDISITTGIGRGTPDFEGGIFSPRTWNGTIYYDLVAAPVPEPATLALLGLGLAGVGFSAARRRRPN